MAALLPLDADGAIAGAPLRGAPLIEALRTLNIDLGTFEPTLAPGDDGRLKPAVQPDVLDALIRRYGILSSDRVTVTPGRPDWPALRAKFIAEHTHDDHEVRVFLDGRGLFHVRTPAGRAALLCEAGDWVAVPAGLPHGFDAGAVPWFDAIRLFSRPDGWVATATGVAPPPRLVSFEDVQAALSPPAPVPRSHSSPRRA